MIEYLNMLIFLLQLSLFMGIYQSSDQINPPTSAQTESLKVKINAILEQDEKMQLKNLSLSDEKDLKELSAEVKKMEDDLIEIQAKIQNEQDKKAISDELRNKITDLIIATEMRKNLLNGLEKDPESKRWTKTLEACSFDLPSQDESRKEESQDESRNGKEVSSKTETVRLYVNNLGYESIERRILLAGVEFTTEPTTILGKIRNYFFAKTNLYYSLIYINEKYFLFKDPVRLFDSEEENASNKIPELKLDAYNKQYLTIDVNTSGISLPKMELTINQLAKIKSLLFEHITFWSKKSPDKELKIELGKIQRYSNDNYFLVAKCKEKRFNYTDRLFYYIRTTIGDSDALFIPRAILSIGTLALSPALYLGEVIFLSKEALKANNVGRFNRYILLSLTREPTPYKS